MDFSQLGKLSRDIAMALLTPILGGILWVVYTVPARMEQVLSNKAEIQKIEPQIQQMELRITKLEAKHEAK